MLWALAGLTLAIASAQEEIDPMAPASFTFTTEAVGVPEMDAEDEMRGDWSVDAVEASDPRASGRQTTLSESILVTTDDAGFFVTTATRVRLVNDDGAWSGTGRELYAVLAVDEADFLATPSRGYSTAMTVLTGEGGFEGLTLFMNEYWDRETQASWGVILPSDKVPPFPDRIEQTNE